MGLRGPRKKPTVLEDLHGRPGRRKPNPLEPKPGGTLFDVPRWMSKDQRAEWRYIVDSSVPGLLTSVDRANLTAYVVATCLHRRASRELAKSKDGLVVAIGERGARQQHPLVAIINRQALILIRAAAEMGFTPASRSRVAADGEVPPPNGQPVITKTAGLAAFAGRNPDARPH